MKDIGKLGEELVSRWLELQNYDLLQQNWRCRWGEIDIIAQDRQEKTIAFVEVKTRSKNNWDEGGLLAVDYLKQEKIIKTATLFLAKYPQLAALPCRFDVALISYVAQGHLSQSVADENTKDEAIKVFSLDIGVPVVIKRDRLVIENYLKSAFEV